jgi:NAD(P)-dependent dehydrogenase (short-subunit alcohol dehydrogenase family)
MELEGRIAIVSGGGQGIGAAISRAMTREGATVIIADIRDEPGGVGVGCGDRWEGHLPVL